MSNLLPSKNDRGPAVLRCGLLFAAMVLGFAVRAHAAEPLTREALRTKLEPYFTPPAEFATDLGGYASPLKFADGSQAKSAGDWKRRRAEIAAKWQKRLGAWPPLVERPTMKILETVQKDGYTKQHVHIQISNAGQQADGYLLTPPGTGPFPAVFVPFYEPLTSIGEGAKGKGTHDYGLQLVRRGFVTLSIGTPGSVEKIGKDTRQLLTEAGEELRRQPLTLLAYVAANCQRALAQMPAVDPARIGVIGLSYGGKWSMFSSCLHEPFACAVWSDPGIVFNEKNGNVNYWEPWYLGYDPQTRRKPGVPSDANPRTGLYKELIDAGDDLVDFHALIAPRPVLVSGGTEDPPRNWRALNHLVAVNKVLGLEKRVAMTARATHVPTAEALELELAFLEYWLKHELPASAGAGAKVGTSGAPPQPIAERKSPTADELKRQATAALAQISGELRQAGLREPVDVIRDRWGVAHIYAKNQHDLFFAQGFVAAQDRLFQIDTWRRIGNGETAEIVGEAGIEADRYARLMLYRGDWDAEWKSYSPDTREIATAFTSGINAWIEQCEQTNRLPIEFQLLGQRPKRWRPEDVLSRMSGIIMTSNWQREVARARLVAAHGVEAAKRIAPTDPPQDFAPAPGLDLNAIQPEIADGYLAATKALRFQPNQSESNNWVVDGSRTQTGKPLLASDPHRAIALPSLRYLVHLNAPGWNVIGAGEPALPGVAIGHNDHIGWGFTIIGTDQADLFVEELDPANPTRYRVGNDWQPLTIVREPLTVRGKSKPITLELAFTRHGPVIYRDSARNIAVSLKWVGAEPGGAAYLGSLAVDRATNRQSFLKALESWKVPGLNFVYADRSGEIGWIAAALTPVRQGWNGLLPVPGASGKYSWERYLSVAELPQSFNPPSHWLATANHNIVPAGYSREIGYEFETPYRFRRIEERLTQQKGKFTIADFQSIQHENTSLPARALTKALRGVTVPEAHRPHAELLANWDCVLSRESGAALLYEVWLRTLIEQFFQAKSPANAKLERANFQLLTVLIAELEKPTEFWFGANPAAGRDRMVIESFINAVRRTQELAGEDLKRWRWGDEHTVTFRHPLAQLGKPYEAAFNLGPIARPGDHTTPNNTRYDDKFRQVHGASYRHVLDFSDWDNSVATSTPGQSGQLGSPHYADLLPLWSEFQYFPLLFTRAKIDAGKTSRLRLVP